MNARNTGGTMRRAAGLVAAGAVVMAACTPVTEPTENVLRRPVELGADRLELAASLESFDSCGQVLDYFQASATEMGASFAFGGAAYAMGGRAMVAETAGDAALSGAREEASAPVTSAPQAGVDYSETNVQEVGVDEPDIVKTDGRVIVAVARNNLYLVDATGDAPVRRGTLALGQANSYGGEAFLEGDRVLLLSNGWREDSAARTSEAIAILTAVDISNLDEPSVEGRLELEGEYVTARLIDGTVRIVLRSAPQFQIQPLPGAETEAQLEREVRTAVASTEVEDWLPSVRTEDGKEEPIVSCDAISRPPEPSGVGTATVLTVDAGADLAIAHSATVVADVATVYASSQSLYIATNGWNDPRILERQAASGDTAEEPFFTTEVHKFDISDPTQTVYAASGRLAGYLLNQWSLSEHQGYLRAATTLHPEWFAMPEGGRQRPSESFVTVLGQQDTALTRVGQVGGLGVDERIYAVRYFGDTGYVVTFRETDPLYVLDLSDPATPRVTGELKILGYSAYLHPVGEGLLLGVGQDATEEGRRLGTQLSLFDVSDSANPTRIHQVALGGGDSPVEFDHRAFLWWAPQSLAVLPVQIYGGGGFAEPAVEEPVDSDDAVAPGSPLPDDHFAGAVGFGVEAGTGFSERGRLTHAGRSAAEPHPMPVMRSLVIGDTLYTLSELGLLASDLGSFGDRGWVAFTP